MSRIIKHKIIASFLLLVFSLSSLAGFACSIGIDMGYNTKHHEHEGDASHSPVKHGHSEKHHQDKQASLTVVKAVGHNEDCCTNDVTSFTKLDKSVADNHLNLQTPIFLLAFTTTFLLQNQDEIGVSVNSRFQFVRRSNFLNDTDIRIAIQSFQI